MIRDDHLRQYVLYEIFKQSSYKFTKITYIVGVASTSNIIELKHIVIEQEVQKDIEQEVQKDRIH